MLVVPELDSFRNNDQALIEETLLIDDPFAEKETPRLNEKHEELMADTRLQLPNLTVVREEDENESMSTRRVPEDSQISARPDLLVVLREKLVLLSQML